ncbi:MAG: tetratricopeptide repeat protein [Spartobacteria bacterium]|nr:tetratricopeptide repeat protein [Spartobacteria bacterium]
MHWLSILGIILVISGLICSILGGEIKARKSASPDTDRIEAVSDEVKDLRDAHKQLVQQSEELVAENQRLKSENGSLAIKNSQIQDELDRTKEQLFAADTTEYEDEDEEEVIYREAQAVPAPEQKSSSALNVPADDDTYPDAETEFESIDHMKKLLADKNYEELQSFADGLIQVYSSWMAPRLYRGTALRYLGNKQDALNDFIFIVENGSGDPMYEKAERALKLMTSKIQDMLDTRQWPGLISACESSISREPEWGLPYYYMGLAYSHIGEKEKAIESLKSFLALQPDDQEAPRAERALRLLNSNIIDMQKKGDYMGLIRACEQEIQKDPTWMTPYYMLGLSYGNLGNRKKAIQNLEKFINEAPDDPDYENAIKVLNHLQGN